MIYIVTALQAEARAMIRQFNMKKNNASHSYEVYESDELRLIVTGTGKVASAVATTWLISTFAEEPSFVVNVGSAAFAGSADTDGLILANKIVDADTGRAVYPSVLYDLGCAEKTLVTVSRVLGKEDMADMNAKYGETLYDMEASGFYSAASKFLLSSQVLVLKYITDAGAGEELTRELVEERSAVAAGKLVSVIDILQQCTADKTAEDEQQNYDLTELSEFYRFSETSKSELLKLIRYAGYRGIDIAKYLRTDETINNAGRKKAGIKLIEDIKHELLP